MKGFVKDIEGHADVVTRAQDAIDKAVSIACETEGVKGVRNHIKIKKDD